MAQTWPATVPTDIHVGSFREELPDNLLRTSMDVGPDKLRRRTTANIRPWTGSIIMTKSQLATFDTFYVSTLASGSLTFTFAHPRTAASSEMRFANIPTYTPIGGDYWEMSAQWEILP